MSNVVCSVDTCPVILSAVCVVYQGENLIYTGITDGDNLQAALQKIDGAFADAGLGYAFQNGIIQTTPGVPVELGGALLRDTTIAGNYKLTLAGRIQASALITTGGTSSQFVKGDGSLDSTVYQVAGNYITALTGDGTASGPGSALLTLATVNANPGTYGSATLVPRITVDAKGRVTSITTTAIPMPSGILVFEGDVTGSGTTGAPVTLTLATVNPNVYNSLTFLNLKVNAKGLVTGASPVTNLDIEGALGYVPVPNSRTITINGITQSLQANRTWTLPVGVSSVTASAPLSSTGGASPNISITKADASTDGYLDNVDWVTFNAKQAALDGTGLVRMSGTTVSYDNTAYTPQSRTLTINGVTFDLSANRAWSIDSMIYPEAGIAVSTGTAWGTSIVDNSTNWNTAYTERISSASSPLSIGSNAISISQAGAATNGYLSSTDWNTFNNKQPADNYITSLTGEATAIGPGIATVTLSTPAVTSKLLTGVNITGGTVLDTDSILIAVGKLQNQINGLIGGSIYQGVWNASTNTPTLTSSVGTDGHYYIVNVAGSTNLNGITDWKVGDWAIFHDTAWQKVDNTDAVVSVNGYTGAVSLVSSDIPEGLTNLYYTPARARTAISLTTTGSSGAATYDNITGILNVPNYGGALTGYVPYTGATANVDLGTHTIIAAKGTFSSSGSGDTVGITHSSGSGIALNISKGGNGEGLYINKTSGSGNAATIIGTLNATTLVKSGGTSSQFLKADGSVDSTAYLPLAGGTMTGAIVGTIATFVSSTFITALGITLSGSTGDGIKITHSAGRAFNLQSSGSGFGILINNETASTSAPFTIQKQGGSVITLTDAGAGSFNSSLTASSFIRTGGTSAQFLKANGSVDSTAYGTGTVTSVGGTGTVSGLSLSGTVTTSGNLTLGGTLSLTSGNVTTALGYTPYNSTNPSGFITSSGTTTGNVVARGQSNWSDATVIGNVVGMLGWKNYGNGHVIFDASNSISPSGTTVSSTNATNAWTGTYPTLMGWNGSQTYGVRVDSARVADSANYVTWINIDNKPALVMYYQGFELDANTMGGNTTGFTYSQNAPYTGPIARFSETGYSLQLNAAYAGGGTGIAFRTRNGDAGTFNPWRVILNDANYTSYSPSLTGSGASGTWGINITGNAATATSATTAGSAPNGSNINNYYNCTAGEGYGFRFWNGSESYKLSMGVGAEYQYGPVSDYSIKLHMGEGANRGITMGRTGSTPTFAHNTTSGNTQVAGTVTAPTFSGALSGNAATATTASNSTSLGGFTSGTYIGKFGNGSGYYQVDNWIQVNANTGLYWPSHYGLHFYPNNDGSYGSAQILGDKNGWKGLHFGGGTGMTLMMNETEFGFHRQANGWSARFTSGTGHFNISGNSATTSQREFNYLRVNSNNNLYLDHNYGCSVVGLYESTRFQGVFSMGDAYKLAIDGTSPGNLYGLSWSHPNAGGQAGFLNSHGLMVMVNGVTYSALSSNIWARGRVTANEDVYSNGGWFYSYNNAGWYNNTYGQGLRQSKGNVTYGNVINVGENFNGWAGYNAQNTYTTTFMTNSNGDHGFYQENGNGWTFFHHRGYNCAGIGTDETDPSYSLHIIKYGGSNTGWIIWSDRRIKENIKTIDNALDKVLSLRGVYYNKIDDPNKERCVGYIAQEVMEVVPELVVYSEELDMYNMNYGPMVAMLTEAMKEQQAQIEELKQQVQTLLNS